MIIKGDLDRMAEDIGHAGKSCCAQAPGRAEGQAWHLGGYSFRAAVYMSPGRKPSCY